jgi:hypothetical protein
MKSIACGIGLCVLLLAGCADPGGITNPVVENPKPVELTITGDHLSEAEGGDVSLSKNDANEFALVPASTPNVMWSNPTDLSSIHLDTATGRILRMRLSLVPKFTSARDTLAALLRGVVLELDSTAKVYTDERERSFLKGEAVITIRKPEDSPERVSYLKLRVDPNASDLPTELKGQVRCTLKVWRTSRRGIVFRLVLQHFVGVHRQGQREFRRIRVSVLGQVPLPS